MHFSHQEITEKFKIIINDMGITETTPDVQRSSRPDISEFQSNLPLKLAKRLRKSPQDIGNEIVERFGKTNEYAVFSEGGFLNFSLHNDALNRKIYENFNTGVDLIADESLTVVIDYGGPNVAKPLHIGHLRSAIIGEALKRIGKSIGHSVISDVHLGDWGAQMGQIIAEFQLENPDWHFFTDPYFEDKESQAPFTSEELNAVYPRASSRCKKDETFNERAQDYTSKLQSGDYEGITALWRKFVEVSIKSIKHDYSQLDVDFDYWYGESDAHPYIAPLEAKLRAEGIAVLDDGALIVPVQNETDKKDIPPLMLRKSNGAVGYGSTDLATIAQRVKDFAPDKIVYVVDKRQSEHFVQVFRAAEMADLISQSSLTHVAFGTMNGPDNRPFKTRDGGVVALSDMIERAKDLALDQTGYKADELDEELVTMIEAIATASIKFGDLQNPYYSDYQFNPEEFVRFEGKTGPYIQYALVRARKILENVDEIYKDMPLSANYKQNEQERALIVQILFFRTELHRCWELKRPDILCSYAYELARKFNVFYRNCPVISPNNDPETSKYRYALTYTFIQSLDTCCKLLALKVPKEMTRKIGEEK